MSSASAFHGGARSQKRSVVERWKISLRRVYAFCGVKTNYTINSRVFKRAIGARVHHIRLRGYVIIIDSLLQLTRVAAAAPVTSRRRRRRLGSRPMGCCASAPYDDLATVEERRAMALKAAEARNKQSEMRGIKVRDGWLETA